jgi:hypothetical protein
MSVLQNLQNWRMPWQQGFCSWGRRRLDLVNQLPGVGCIYVEDNGKMSASKKYRFKKI